jgi:RNA polymerase sigma factor (sigma-70 family)
MLTPSLPSTEERLEEINNFLKENKNQLWFYYGTIQDAIKSNTDSNDLSDIRIWIIKRRIVQVSELINLVNVSEETAKNDPENLRHLQKLAIVGYIRFLILSISWSVTTWYVLAPTGQWKTRTALLFAKTSDKKTLIISDGNTWAAQFQKESEKMGLSESVEIIWWKVSRKSQKIQITNWQQLSIWIEAGAIRPWEYGQIFVDEADINWLSPDRVELLRKWSQEHNILVVWFSATEYQWSGKKISDFYKYDILDFPMPESLPELYNLWELPSWVFQDRYLNATMKISDDDKDDISEPTIANFIETTSWLDQIFAYHVKENKWKKFILWMRNNQLIDLIIEKASKAGVKVKALTWEMSMEDRNKVLSELKVWSIDGIVGSRLSWRWLDVPECDVVYASLLTFSPQIFWQLMGRALRIDPNNSDKRVDIVNFLPSWITLESLEEQEGDWDDPITIKNINLTQYKTPLSFQAFFDMKYFKRKEGKEREVIPSAFKQEIQELTKEQISSIAEVMALMKAKNMYGSFTGKPEILWTILRRMPYVSMNNLIKFALSIKWNVAIEAFLRSHVENPWREYAYAELAKKYPIPEKPLTLDYEKEVVAEYMITSWEEKLQKRDIILSYHYPIILSLAIVIADRAKKEGSHLTVDDFIQIWVEWVLSKLGNLYVWSRFSGFCAINALASMLRMMPRETNLIYIPDNVHAIAMKVQQMLACPNPENLSDEKRISEYLWQKDGRKDGSSRLISQVKLMLRILEMIKIKSLPLGEELEGDFTMPYYHTDINNDPENEAMRWERRDDVEEVISTLSPREKKILQMHNGFTGSIKYPVMDESSLDEIGLCFDVTRERIRQIEAKALRKLRRNSVLLGLLSD